MTEEQQRYDVFRGKLLEELPQLLAELLRRAGPAALPAGGNTGSGYIPANGSVTTPKLADASVTPAKLSFDPATQAELEAALAAHTQAADPHPQYLTQPEGDTRYALLSAVPPAPSAAGQLLVSLDGVSYSRAYPLIEDGLWLLGDNNEPLYGEG